MEEKIRETIEQLNKLLGESPYKLDLISPKEIKLADKNARYMSHDVFQNLVSNIKKDKALTSLPLCYRENDKMVVLSGNHRVQAAVHAGLERIMVLVVDKKLSRQDKVAIQLSHNAIAGQDDPVILRELWDEIQDIGLKMYSGIDTETIKALEKMEFATIAESRLDFKQIIFLFLPEEIEQIKLFLEDIDILCSGDENYIISRKHYDEVFRLLLQVKEKYGIINNPTAFMKVIEMAKLQIGMENETKTMPTEKEKNH